MSDVDHAERFIQESLVGYLDGRVTLAELIGLGPQDLKAIMQLGISNLKAGQQDKASKLFELATAMEPGWYMGFQYLGMSCEQSGARERAAEAYARATSLLEASAPLSAEDEEISNDISMLLINVLLQLERAADARAIVDRLSAREDRLSAQAREHLASFHEALGAAE